ncbi:Uncharacterised protein [Escherichia coli]|nr:Uncharacterised protein [Escherichia coli]
MSTPENEATESSLIEVSDQSSAIVDFDDIYESPTISRLPMNQRPKPSTVCERCPAAVWFALPKELRCYCRVIHAVIYSNEEKNALTACDGRDMAIEQLLAKQEAADAAG